MGRTVMSGDRLAGPAHKIPPLRDRVHLAYLAEVGWPIVVFLLTGAIFFRAFLLSGFDTVVGEYGDARLAIFIREHLFQFLSGAARFTSPPMFFPIKDTLGYSDAYLLDALIYVPARMLGADPFLGFQLTAMGLSLIGFVSFNLLLTRHAAIRQPLAAMAAAAFTFSNALFISVGHPQLLEVNFCPLITVLALQAVRDRAGAPVRAVITGSASGAILGLLFGTGYYVAWYYLLAGMLTVVVYGILQNGLSLRQHAGTIGSNLRIGAAFGGGFILGLVPFCLIYLPVIRGLPGRGFSEYLFYAPAPGDLINVGAYNRVWGRVLASLGIVPDARLDNGELVLAITPILLATYLGSVAAVLSGRVLAESRHRALRHLILASFAAFAGIVVTMVKFHEHSLFSLLWNVMPGARAIRAGGRAQIVLNGIALAASAVVLTSLFQRTRARHLKALLWLLPILILLEQLNNNPDHARLSRGAEMTALAAAPRPPAACKSFFISPHSSHDGRRVGDAIEQIDAMLLAQRVGLPTLNGYSGLSPPGWRMGKIEEGSYLGSTWSWAERHAIEAGLCEYDYTARHWQASGGAEPYAVYPGAAMMFRRGGDGEAAEGEGWSDPEGSGTWTNAGEAKLLVNVRDWRQAPMAVEVSARPFLMEGRHPAVDVEVVANGRAVGTWTYDIVHDAGLARRVAIIPEIILAQSPLLNLTFRIREPMAPSEAGISDDSRRLGIFVSRMSFFRIEDHSVIREPPRIAPGRTVSFADGGDSEPFVGERWSGGEPSGTWTVGPRAVVSAQMSGWAQDDMVVTVAARPYLVKQRHPQLDVGLVANQVAVGHWTFREQQDRGIVTRSVRIPASVLARSPILNLELALDAPSSPGKLEPGSSDARQIGLMVAQIRFDRAQP